MANKSNIQVPQPSALDRARQTADREKADAISAQQLSQSSTPDPLANALDEAIGDVQAADIRVTRTFTLTTATNARLKQAAELLGTNKSAVLERAFNEWFNVVDRRLANK